MEGYDLHVGGGAGPGARIGRLVRPKVAHDELGPVVLSLLQAWQLGGAGDEFRDFAARLSDAEIDALCQAGLASAAAASTATLLEPA